MSCRVLGELVITVDFRQEYPWQKVRGGCMHLCLWCVGVLAEGSGNEDLEGEPRGTFAHLSNSKYGASTTC